MNDEDATAVHRIHDNDRPPNYRENGQLRLMYCFYCNNTVIHFGASDFTCCPHCQWSEQSEFDWNEFQSSAFEAIFVVVMSQYPQANPAVASSIAYDIIKSAAGSYGAMALGDGLEGYIRTYVHEELMEAPIDDAHPGSFNHEKYCMPEFHKPVYPGIGRPIFLQPRAKAREGRGHRRPDQAEVPEKPAGTDSGRREEGNANGDHESAERREEPRLHGSDSDSTRGGDRDARGQTTTEGVKRDFLVYSCLNCGEACDVFGHYNHANKMFYCLGRDGGQIPLYGCDKYNIQFPITKKSDNTAISKEEPIFILRAQDKLMPAMLMVYAIMLEQAGNQKMATEVLGLVWDVEIWQGNNATKIPNE